MANMLVSFALLGLAFLQFWLAFLQYQDSSVARQAAERAESKASKNESMAENSAKTLDALRVSGERAGASLSAVVAEAHKTAKRLSRSRH